MGETVSVRDDGPRDVDFLGDFTRLGLNNLDARSRDLGLSQVHCPFFALMLLITIPLPFLCTLLAMLVAVVFCMRIWGRRKLGREQVKVEGLVANPGCRAGQ